MSKKRKIPLIKENRINRLTQVLRIFNKYPYDREMQKDSILELYPNKTEKSVFRGMVIPSLRYLGLIIGYENFIRLSANGRIILEGGKKGKKEELRIWRALMLELDFKKFKFLKKIKNDTNIKKEILIEKLSNDIEGPSKIQISERIKKWLRMIIDCKLIKSSKNILILDRVLLKDAEDDLKVNNKRKIFKNILFEEYRSFPYKETAGIVDIADLREQVAKKIYEKFKKILTESQFDILLREMPLVTDKYIISLGHPMGAEEKLFNYKGEYYRTINITFFNKEGKKNV